MIRQIYFTLVELLITIAIIMILASLLLPGIRNAKNAAKNILCKNNLKQINYAFEGYRSDYNGLFPPILEMGTPSGGAGTETWAYWFSINCFNTKILQYQCPFFISDPGRGYWVHYGYNYYIPERVDTAGYNWKFGRLVKVPSQVVLHADSVFDKTETPQKGFYNVTGYSRVSQRHPGMESNLSYCDGHVSSYRWKTLPGAADYDHPMHQFHFYSNGSPYKY